jgi:hypothetical protein
MALCGHFEWSVDRHTCHYHMLLDWQMHFRVQRNLVTTSSYNSSSCLCAQSSNTLCLSSVAQKSTKYGILRKLCSLYWTFSKHPLCSHINGLHVHKAVTQLDIWLTANLYIVHATFKCPSTSTCIKHPTNSEGDWFRAFTLHLLDGNISKALHRFSMSKNQSTPYDHIITSGHFVECFQGILSARTFAIHVCQSG